MRIYINVRPRGDGTWFSDVFDVDTGERLRTTRYRTLHHNDTFDNAAAEAYGWALWHGHEIQRVEKD